METAANWTLLDIFLRWLRFIKVKKYIPDKAVICDIGCGLDGYMLRKLAPKISAGTGLDRQINAKNSAVLTFAEADLEKKLPLPDSSYDIVICSAVLEHLSDQDILLKEIRRILKVGGKTIITVPTTIAEPILNILIKIKMMDPITLLEHKRYYTKQSLNAALEHSGLTISHISYFEMGANLLAIAEKTA